MGLFLPDPIGMSYKGSRSGLAFPWGQIVSAPQLGDTSHGGGRWLYPHPSPPPISLPLSLGSQHDFPRGFMDLFPAGLWMRLEGAAQPPLPLPITPPRSPPRGALRCQALISSPPPTSCREMDGNAFLSRPHRCCLMQPAEPWEALPPPATLAQKKKNKIKKEACKLSRNLRQEQQLDNTEKTCSSLGEVLLL